MPTPAGNHVTAQPPADIVVVALAAGEIELALPGLVEAPAGFDMGAAAARPSRQPPAAPRAQGDGGGQREQRLALVAEGRGLLVVGAATLDAVSRLSSAPSLATADSGRRRRACRRSGRGNPWQDGRPERGASRHSASPPSTQSQPGWREGSSCRARRSGERRLAGARTSPAIAGIADAAKARPRTIRRLMSPSASAGAHRPRRRPPAIRRPVRPSSSRWW